MLITQITKLGPPLKVQEIEAFERQIGHFLPGEYRRFLMDTNGGDPKDAAHFFVREALRQPNVWTRVRFFYGLRRSDVGCWTLNEVLELREELIVEGLLPIGTDDFGNEICLNLKGEIGAVYFWIHDRDVPNERLAGSFDEFFKNLTHRDQAEKQ